MLACRSCPYIDLTYDLACDKCDQSLSPAEPTLAWTTPAAGLTDEWDAATATLTIKNVSRP